MNLTYELFEDGYFILLNGQRWIAQGGEYGGFFPNPIYNEDGTLNLEESCKAHISKIVENQERAINEENAKQEQLDTIEANTSYLVMLSEMESEVTE